MNVIVVDDEPLALKRVLSQLKKLELVTDAQGFDTGAAALDYLQTHSADVALLDINLCGVTGLELAKRAKALCPRLAVIFLTGYGEYALDAFKLHASGYLLKPATLADLQNELELVREQTRTSAHEGLYVQTFGNFEVFCNGQRLKFARSKSKELFAYLIDRRGAMVSVNEIAAVLWEDEEESRSLHSQVRNCIVDLQHALTEVGQEQLLVKERGGVAIDADRLSCDYYDFLKGGSAAISAYTGEYMTGYSWAEFTTAALCHKSGIY